MLLQRCVLETVCFLVRWIVFNFFHNFKFEGEGIRIWRAYGIGQGKLIPYQDLIVKPQGPTGLVVNEIFLLLKVAWFYKSTINSDGEKSNDLFACSEPGYNMVCKKCSELESHLNIGEHCHIRRNFDKAYDRLKRDWAEKFLIIDREDSDSAPLESSGEEQHERGTSSAGSEAKK